MYLWIHDNRAPQVSNSMYGRDKCFKCNNFTDLTIFSGILAQLCRNCLLVQEVVMLYWFQSLHTYFSFLCTFFVRLVLDFFITFFPFACFPLFARFLWQCIIFVVWLELHIWRSGFTCSEATLIVWLAIPRYFGSCYFSPTSCITDHWQHLLQKSLHDFFTAQYM